MTEQSKIRFAVVGLGHFAQSAILPAFREAKDRARLAALVTGDPIKAKELGEEYKVPVHSYEQFDEVLQSGTIDAVYIAVPNSEHCKYAVKSAEAGVHVLCEKPLAYTVADARSIVEACRDAEVKLMTAYRLHFEEGNLDAIEAAHNGTIGEARIFRSIHTTQIDPDNIRVDQSLGGGSLEDIGIYCLNAARYIFRAEPEEVSAFAVKGSDPRFAEIPEAVSVMMRFPGERLGTFICGFGEAHASEYCVIGTEGMLVMSPAFTWQGDIVQRTVIKGKEKTKTFKHRDQIAAEILYFAKCVQTSQEPEPSGWEGLIDVEIIDGIRESYREHRNVRLNLSIERSERPDLSQSIDRKAHGEVKTVNVAPPSNK